MNEDDFDLEEVYGGLLDLIESNMPKTDDPVKHYGVKGMHWGVRKDRLKSTREPLKSLGPDSVSRKTASGETITLRKVPPSKLHNFLGRISPKYREGYANEASLDILDGSGKKVGDANVQKKNDEELYLNWLGIDKSARGKGYATAVMKAGRDFGKQQGFKRMTLEVPGNSPDARHIYEKLGFKVTKEGDPTDDSVWGGLTDMVYEFDAKHSELIHHGVKGMHWGVRKGRDDSPNPRYSARRRAEDQKTFGKGGVKRINRRMNKGQKLAKAQQNEAWRQIGKAAIVAGSVQAARIVLANKDVLAQQVAVRAETKRGQAATANAMGLPRRATSGPSYAKQKRGSGAYKITNL